MQQFYAKLGGSEAEKIAFQGAFPLGRIIPGTAGLGGPEPRPYHPITQLDCPGTPDADLCAGFLATRADTEVCNDGGR